MSDSGASYIETLEIEQWKLLRNSNGHIFSHGCPIQVHNVSRRSKLNNGFSRAMQMEMTFHSDVRFRRIIYLVAWNWTMETLENFQWSYLFTRLSNSGAYVSRRLNLNNRSSREIQMVINFHTNIRFGRIIDRDARNCTGDALEKLKWSSLFTRRPD